MNHLEHNFIYLLNVKTNQLFDIDVSVLGIDRKRYLSGRSVQRYMNKNIPVKDMLVYNEAGFFEMYQNRAFCYILLYKLEKCFDDERIISKDYVKNVICKNINLNDYVNYVKSNLSFDGANNLNILTKQEVAQNLQIDYESFIFECVSQCHNISENDFRYTTCKKRESADARFAAMWCFKHYTKYSLKQIGRLFASKTGVGKDHSTVINALNTYTDLLETDNAYKRKHLQLVETIEQYL